MKKENIKYIILIILIAIVCSLLFFYNQCSKVNNRDEDTNNPAKEISTKENYQDDFSPEPLPTPNIDVYLNNKTITCKDANGGELSVGIDLTGEQGISGLVINPKYTNNHLQGEKVGYYIEKTYMANLDTSQKDYFNAEDENGIKNIFIDWTKDHSKSAEYSNPENFGVKWSVSYQDKSRTTDTLTISVIDVYTYDLLADYTVTISQSNGKYEFKDVFCNDLTTYPADVWEGKMSIYNDNELREELINNALNDLLRKKIIESAEEVKKDKITCCLLDKPRHKYFLSTDNSTLVSPRYNKPLFAVTIQSVSPSLGFYTLYYNSKLKIVGLNYYWTVTDDDILNLTTPYGFTDLR